jgi:hypothetical protein
MKKDFKLKEIYKKFCDAEGNQHIASEYAIRKLQKIIKRNEVGNVLELGLGIGSIAGSLLKLNVGLNYYGTEANAFCRKALIKNLGNEYSRLNLFSQLSDIPRNIKFDLVIIDGKDDGMNLIPEFVSDNAIIAVEGDRIWQQNKILELFPKNKYAHCISIRKNEIFSPFPTEAWQGGLKIIWIKPSINNNLWWLLESIKTKIKYQLPGRHFGVN